MRVLAIPQGHGWLLTIRPHRANGLLSWSGTVAARRARRARRSLRERTRSRVTASSAGTRVRAESMVTATTMAAASPSAPMKGTAET